jgi:magnesium-transporting ATPase (P-type)
MGKRMKFFIPFIFALFSLLFHVLHYRPPVGSEDFITALLVFFAALGWSSVIVLARVKKQWVFYAYAAPVIIIPLLIVLFSKNAALFWHLTVIGLYSIALVGLRLYMSAYLGSKEKKIISSSPGRE